MSRLFSLVWYVLVLVAEGSSRSFCSRGTLAEFVFLMNCNELMNCIFFCTGLIHSICAIVTYWYWFINFGKQCEDVCKCCFVTVALFPTFWFALDMYAGDRDSRHIQVLIASWKRSWHTRRKKRSNQMVPPKETTDLLNICCSVCSFLVQVVVGKFLWMQDHNMKDLT